LFGLSFFHAVIQERRKFGPLGWNIPYDWNDSDLSASVKSLKNYLEENDSVPWETLKYVIGVINYGGRVTDDWDIRTLMTMIKSYIGEYVLEDGFKFSPSGMYKSVEVGEHASYIEYIRTLSINPSPEVFGLHDNADITCAQAETKNMMDTLVSLQPKQSSAGGKTREEVIEEVSLDIQSRVPPVFDTETVMAKYPTKYEESMNTVLVQEVIRYNKLLKAMKKSLADILKALKGLVVMSSELEAVGTSLFNNQVPEMWADRAYPSLMPLASWIVDLIYRIDFIRSWYEEGIPAVYWISGFFFPQAFLTGTLQNYARKYAVSIDTVSFDFEIMDIDESDLPVPEDGCYIKGLYLEGARWDPETKSLVESRARELYTEVPVIWLRPVSNRKKPEYAIYYCPMYKTLTRAGTLSTTGHSTNYVVTLELPSSVDPDHWIRRGVACFTALDYRI
jgi:dynein heavy chain